jgi:hypothetical protein
LSLLGKIILAILHQVTEIQNVTLGELTP